MRHSPSAREARSSGCSAPPPPAAAMVRGVGVRNGLGLCVPVEPDTPPHGETTRSPPGPGSGGGNDRPRWLWLWPWASVCAPVASEEEELWLLDRARAEGGGNEPNEPLWPWVPCTY